MLRSFSLTILWNVALIINFFTGGWILQGINGLYCVGDSCFPGQGVIAVAFSGVMCAHRVAADLGKYHIQTIKLVNTML